MKTIGALVFAGFVLAAPARGQTVKSVAVHGNRLAYIESGRGEPVLFIHGSLGDYRNWSHQMAPFAARYRVLALSRRYHWPNRWIDDGRNYTFDRQLEDLGEVIRRLHLGPVHLVGHSYGASLALALTLQHPELVRDVVLAEPAVFALVPPGPAIDSMQSVARTVIGGVLAEFAKGDTATALQSFMRWAIGPLDIPKADPDGWRRLLQNAASLAAQLKTPPPAHPAVAFTCEAVGKLARPALLVTGSDSPRAIHQADDALAGCVPAMKRIVVPKASHAMFIDNPEDFNRQVLEFLGHRE